jgi:hypothetical protein
LEFACGHAALVSLPRIRGERPHERAERISQEKLAARSRPCDFCAPWAEAAASAEPDTSDGAPAQPEAKELLMDTPANQEPSPADQAEAGPGKTSGDADGQAATRPRGVFPPPRKLTDDQEREVTRLYAETPTPLAEIGRTYGISETSVSRIAQRHGADLRRRAGATVADGQSLASGTRGRPAAAAAVSPEPPAVARGGRARRRAADSAGPRRRRRSPATAVAELAAEVAVLPMPVAAAAAPIRQAAVGSARRRFRITFLAEQVIEAEDIRDAITQAEALGATDITSIAREF